MPEITLLAAVSIKRFTAGSMSDTGTHMQPHSRTNTDIGTKTRQSIYRVEGSRTKRTLQDHSLVNCTHPIRDLKLFQTLADKQWNAVKIIDSSRPTKNVSYILSFSHISCRLPLFRPKQIIQLNIVTICDTRIQRWCASTWSPVALRNALYCHIFKRESPRAGRLERVWFSTPCWMLWLNI